jgi:hypothetical protein
MDQRQNRVMNSELSLHNVSLFLMLSISFVWEGTNAPLCLRVRQKEGTIYFSLTRLTYIPITAKNHLKDKGSTTDISL